MPVASPRDDGRVPSASPRDDGRVPDASPWEMVSRRQRRSQGFLSFQRGFQYVLGRGRGQGRVGSPLISFWKTCILNVFLL